MNNDTETVDIYLVKVKDIIHLYPCQSFLQYLCNVPNYLFFVSCDNLKHANLPEMSMAYFLASQCSEIQKFDSLPWILSSQERDSGLFPYPSPLSKVPAQNILVFILNFLKCSYLICNKRKTWSSQGPVRAWKSSSVRSSLPRTETTCIKELSI